MKTIAAILSVIVILSIAAWAQTPSSQPVASQPTSASDLAPKLLVKMHREEGWDIGTVCTFVLNDDGTFTWVRWQDKKPAETLVGTLPKEKVQALMDHLAAAGAGVGAKDAGTATFEYIDNDKANRKKQYTYPSGPPCSGLLTEIDLLARTHGKALGATAQSQPASRPATRPVDANAVAELIQRLGDNDYTIREESTKKLKAMGESVMPLLKAKLKEKNLDPEVAHRIEIVLEPPTPTQPSPEGQGAARSEAELRLQIMLRLSGQGG